MNKPRGRPHDPHLVDRVLDAAVSLYANGGWSAFTFEAVAKTAKVGKAALYKRWPNREALLGETLDKRWLATQNIDTGTFRGDLEQLAKALFTTFSGSTANVILYLQADGLRYPEVGRVRAAYMEGLIKASRQIVARAIKRGEIAEDTNTALILDILTGAISNHIGTTPNDFRSQMTRKSGEYINALITALEKIAAR